MRNLSQYHYVVFDCDGVILQSNTIKTVAFTQAVIGTSAHIDAFIHYHQTHGGISRYVKFRHYYETIYPVENPEAHIQTALQQYQAIVETQLLTCPLVSGVDAVLAQLQHLNIPCYVCSGGDEQELRRVFKQRRFESWFNEIYGSPKTKLDILNILATYHPNARGLYFGDAQSDYKAAQHFHLDFIFVSEHSEWKEGVDFCKTHHIAHIDNFLQLAE